VGGLWRRMRVCRWWRGNVNVVVFIVVSSALAKEIGRAFVLVRAGILRGSQ